MVETFATEGSSRVTGMSYDTDTLKLRIDFKRGGSYMYSDVPREVYDDLITSPSVGKAIDRLVRQGGYPYSKV